jgi:hypothetical protein
MRKDRFEGPRPGIGPNMKFVENIVLQRETDPASILPGKLGPNNLRGPVNSSGLKPGSGIGPVLIAVQAVKIQGARVNIFYDPLMVPAFPGDGNGSFFRGNDMDLYSVYKRGPDPKLASSPAEICRSRKHIHFHVFFPGFRKKTAAKGGNVNTSE